MSKRKKITLIITIFFLTIILMVGITTAFFGWRAENEATVDVTIAEGSGKCYLKRDNNIFIAPSNNKNGGRVIELIASQTLGDKGIITWEMNVKKIEGLKDKSFKYEMINKSTGASYGRGTFENITDGSTITFSNSEEILGYNMEYEFILYLWIDGNIGDYQNSLAGQTLDFDIKCNLSEATSGEITLPYGNLATYIKKLYTTANPTKITQTESGTQYYQANSVNLVNDGLDTEGNATNSRIEGNIRYYGKSPNNYIYFNCDDYNNQTNETCEKWRIIGVFGDKVKIVSEESIGLYAWDSNDTNNWSNATLNKLLNNNYFNNTIDRGIKNEITQALISNSIWYLGTLESISNQINETYRSERSDESTWQGKISLMNPSDYLYARDLTVGTINGNTVENNWLENGDTIWFLNPSSTKGWYTLNNGLGNDAKTSTQYNIYPTLYLNPEISIINGNGTSDSPFIIETKNAVEYIKNLYLDNKDTIVLNNNQEYKHATAVSLMNDRLGGTTTDYDAGNIRYFGKNPNNYVDIGDRTSDNKVILYRIIGLFKDVRLADGTVEDLIKVIRADSIGSYPFDNKTKGLGSSTSDNGSNYWGDSRLMMLLNPGYETGAEDSNKNIIYEYEGSLWWNSKSGTCYTEEQIKDCNFTSIGISTNVQNKIETVIWDIGGYDKKTSFPDEYYRHERAMEGMFINPTEWLGKVAIMYTSDYGYATDFNKCKDSLYNYNITDCKNNWLYKNNIYQWQLTPSSSDKSLSTIVYQNGHVEGGSALNDAPVNPTFYLKSNLVLARGTGTNNDPYVIG